MLWGRAAGEGGGAAHSCLTALASPGEARTGQAWVQGPPARGSASLPGRAASQPAPGEGPPGVN